MIIAKGNVHTAEGPVPVEKLETGMLVVDRGHRARKLLKVEQVQLHQTLHFEKNPELVDRTIRQAVYFPACARSNFSYSSAGMGLLK